MIDKEILDAVLPVPDLEKLRDSTVAELRREGFAITNFHSGGVFHTMLMIVLRVRIEFVELLRTVLSSMFLSHAEGVWLDIKAADFSKKRKKAQKTQGYVTLSRQDAAGEAVRAPDDDVLVRSAETVVQPIALTVTIPSAASQEGLQNRVAAAVTDLLRIRQRRELNELTHADIIYKVKSEVASIRNVTVTKPAADLLLGGDKVILPGEITVTIKGV